MKATQLNSYRTINGEIKLGHIIALVVTIVLFILIFGLADGCVNPNVRVTYRSALGPGYVLQIVNAGSKPLFNVTVTCDSWTRTYVAKRQLDVGSSTEFGWLEGEPIKPGVTYKISADGYIGSAKVTVYP